MANNNKNKTNLAATTGENTWVASEGQSIILPDDYMKLPSNGNADSFLQYSIPMRERPYFVSYDPTSGTNRVFVPWLVKYIQEHLDYILVQRDNYQALSIYVYENGRYRRYSHDKLKAIIKKTIEEYNENLVSTKVINETAQLVMTDLDSVSQKDLDFDEKLINFSNGLLYITADELRLLPHTPDVYSTIQIPCNWTHDSKPTPVFDGFMETLTDGDRDVEQFLLEYMGACISNIKGWRMKKALFLVGDGDTGKSQLKSLVEKLLGKGNYIGIDLKEIEARFGTGAIFGKRLAGSSDMSSLSIDELKTFKKLTGGDSVFAEFKGEQPFEFTYNGLLWFCSNRLPEFRGDTGRWVYDRIMVVRCPNVIPKEKQDKLLLEKLYEEREGIIYKIVKALQHVIFNGYCFTEPESVKVARDDYMTRNSTVITFFKECMCTWTGPQDGRRSSTGEVYDTYKKWCADECSCVPKSFRIFRDEIATYLRAPYKEITHRIEGKTYFKGYTLLPEVMIQ